MNKECYDKAKATRAKKFAMERKEKGKNKYSEALKGK